MFTKISLFAKKHRVPITALATFVMMLVFATTASHAQTTPVPTLALDVTALQTGLFTGANIMLAALGAIMFIVIGITFGSGIIDKIGDAIKGAL